MSKISDVEEQRSVENDGPNWPKTAKNGQLMIVPDNAAATVAASPHIAQQFPQIVIHRSSTTTEEGDQHNNDDDDEGEEGTEEEGISGYKNCYDGTVGHKNGYDGIFGCCDSGGTDNDGYENSDGDWDMTAPNRETTAAELANSSSSASSTTSAEDVGEGQTIEAAEEAIAAAEERKISTMSGRMKTIQTMMIAKDAAYCSKRAGPGTVVPKLATLHKGATVMGGDGSGGRDEEGTGEGDGAIGGQQFECNSKSRKQFGTTDLKSPPICQHLAKFYHQFGIRHFVLVGVLAFYAVFGGLLFQAIEKENAYISLNKNKEALDAMIEQLAKNLTVLLNVQPSADKMTAMQQLITKDYQILLKIEGKYVGSVFHKYEHIVFHLNWCFGSSVFYAMTLFTTIGYGTIACQTPLGRILSIFYALDIGQLMLCFLTCCYNRLCDIISFWLRSLAFRILEIDEEAAQVAKEKKAEQQLHQLQLNINTKNTGEEAAQQQKQRHNAWGAARDTAQTQKTEAAADFYYATDSENMLISSSDQEENNGIDADRSSSSSATAFDGTFAAGQSAADVLPLFVSVPLVLLYLCFIALVVSCFDWPDQRTGDDGPPLSFGEAFYFAFISLSTIGLGDVMPNSIEFSPLLALLFLGGLALLSVVNLTIYQHIQSLFLFLFDHFETFLDDVYAAQNAQNDAHFVFTSLMPNIQLLALALPIFSDDEKGKMPKATTTAPTPAELLHVRRMFSVSRTPSLLHSDNYYPRKGTRVRAFSIAKSEGQPYQQYHTSSSAHHRSTYHTVHGTDFRPTLGILSTAPSSPARSRGPSIRSRRTSAHKIPGSPASQRPCRKRAMTIGCDFDYAKNAHDGGGGDNNANVDTRQKLSRHKSTSNVWWRTAKSLEAISNNFGMKMPRNLAENEAKSDDIEMQRDENEIGTMAKRDEEAKAPTERRIYFKKEIAESAASSSTAAAAATNYKQIRRTHSERVSQRRRHAHGGAQLYVINEGESHQQTVAGGERLSHLRRLRRQRSRQNVSPSVQQQQQHGHNSGTASVAQTESGDERTQRWGDGSVASSPSSSRRLQMHSTQPPKDADNSTNGE
ncbi:hypothetical protein niasHS_004066 [Heterodera schachtii]|uniref:Potassium channel domain-containing protein n=1 Tax=Heterodera schachtii TaxID=97005 RepID=A0ABD2JUI4_HETSC